jgi:hypothetical protein
VVRLPPYAQNKGWEGFVLLEDANIPNTFPEILKLMNFLFSNTTGLDYYQTMYVDADTPDPKSGLHRWGKKTRDKLRKLRMRFPNLPGISWQHASDNTSSSTTTGSSKTKNATGDDTDWVPPNKELLKGFIKVLMELDELLK